MPGCGLYRPEKGGRMFIGKIDARTKQRILVTIRDVKKVRMIDMRVHQPGEDGELVATPAGLSLSWDQAEQAIELLTEAKRRVADQK
jgi:hypothetical protein